MIICLVNQKGGVGKTTLAINLACCFVRNKGKTILIDADPQGSVLQWQSIADNKAFDVIHHPNPDFHKTIGNMTKGYKSTVIDAPPGAGDITLSILLASRLAIVPIGPSPLDIWSSREIVSLIREARKHNRRLKGKLLISKKVVGTTPGREAREALKGYEIPLLETEIAHRIAFVKAMIEGMSVLEYEPNSEATREIEALYNEITK